MTCSAAANHAFSTAPAYWADLLEESDQQAFHAAREKETLQAVRLHKDERPSND